MTANEMLNLWKVGFGVFASNSAPGFEDSDIFLELNRVQDLVIEELVVAKDWTRLQNIISEIGLTPGLTGTGGTYPYISLPVDYMYYVNSFSTVTRTAMSTTGFTSSKVITSAEPVENQEITSKEAQKFVANTFDTNRMFKAPKAYIREGKLIVIPDSYTTVGSIILRYVKKRREIGNVSGTGDCELDVSLHRLVVERAIDSAKKIIFIQEPQSSK